MAVLALSPGLPGRCPACPLRSIQWTLEDARRRREAVSRRRVKPETEHGRAEQSKTELQVRPSSRWPVPDRRDVNAGDSSTTGDVMACSVRQNGPEPVAGNRVRAAACSAVARTVINRLWKMKEKSQSENGSKLGRK